MALDSKGKDIAVGDEVILRCRVAAVGIGGSGDLCTLRVVDNDNPDSVTSLSCPTKLVTRHPADEDPPYRRHAAGPQEPEKEPEKKPEKFHPGEVRSVPTPGPNEGGRVEMFPEDKPPTPKPATPGTAVYGPDAKPDAKKGG